MSRAPYIVALICHRTDGKITAGRMLTARQLHRGGARGSRANCAVWLREPTREERAEVIPALTLAPGVEIFPMSRPAVSSLTQPTTSNDGPGDPESLCKAYAEC